MSPNAEACGCDYGLTPPYLCEQHRNSPLAPPEPTPPPVRVIQHEDLIEQRSIGHGEGQLHTLQDVLRLPRVRVAVPKGAIVTMEDVIRVADIEALVPR